MRQPVGMHRRQERVAAHQFGGQCCDRRDVHIAAGQRRLCGPAVARLGAAQIGRKPFQRLLGEAAIGRDLAAIDRQQRRAAGLVELENIIAGGRLGFAGAVVIERADAGIGPHHVLGLDRLGQIFADGIAEIFDFRSRRLHLGRVAIVIAIGGADQREIVLVGNHKDDAAVAVLKHVGAVMRIEFRHHDMGALHQPHLGLGVDAGAGRQHLLDPRSAGIDQRAGLNGAALAAGGVFDGDLPDSIAGADFDGARTGTDFGAAVGRVARGEDHQPRVIDKAIRIFKAPGVAIGNQGPADLVARKVDRARRRQQMPAADMVVKKQAEPQQPGRP